jgi:type III restriction enzyme
MLTEGWDANTVTHVLGVRAFGTQLLCEQVIGRALRRQSYDLNEEGPVQRRIRRRARHSVRLHGQAGRRAAAAAARDHPGQGRAPERDALEIRFPRVEGYRVELPEERSPPNSTTTPFWN